MKYLEVTITCHPFDVDIPRIQSLIRVHRRTSTWHSVLCPMRKLTTSVPLGGLPHPAAPTSQARLHELQWVGRAGAQHVPQQRDVSDGQPERVNLGQPLLERERGHVQPQLLKRPIDAHHPLALSNVGSSPRHGAIRVLVATGGVGVWEWTEQWSSPEVNKKKVVLRRW